MRNSLISIRKMWQEKQKITMLTAYDYSTAKYEDEAGVDMILIGDSAAMVVLGYDTTHHIGVPEMAMFTRAVAKGAQKAFIVADMPFMSWQVSLEEAAKNAAELIKAGANAVKIEGAGPFTLQAVERLVEAGIPVMGHLGFTPQSVLTLGGYKVQGKTAGAVKKLLNDAEELVKRGVFAVVLEMVPEEAASYVTEKLEVPTIGIGAGRYCSGQVLVIDDVLGKYADLAPKFAKKYADAHKIIKDAAEAYVQEVKQGAFPAENNIFTLSAEEKEELF